MGPSLTGVAIALVVLWPLERAWPACPDNRQIPSAAL